MASLLILKHSPSTISRSEIQHCKLYNNCCICVMIFSSSWCMINNTKNDIMYHNLTISASLALKVGLSLCGRIVTNFLSWSAQQIMRSFISHDLFLVHYTWCSYDDELDLWSRLFFLLPLLNTHLKLLRVRAGTFSPRCAVCPSSCFDCISMPSVTSSTPLHLLVLVVTTRIRQVPSLTFPFWWCCWD